MDNLINLINKYNKTNPSINIKILIPLPNQQNLDKMKKNIREIVNTLREECYRKDNLEKILQINKAIAQ